MFWLYLYSILFIFLLACLIYRLFILKSKNIDRYSEIELNATVVDKSILKK